MSPDFAYFIGEKKKQTCPQGFYLSCEQTKQSQMCGSIPSLMTASGGGPVHARVPIHAHP